MELKYIKELNNLINDFIRPCGCKAEVDTDFTYYPNEKVVTWSPFMMDKADRYFNEYVKSQYTDIEADIFLWSLLHEVGHHMTYNTWSDELLEEFEKTKDYAASILKEKNLTARREKVSYFMYFSTRDEECATQWAAEYMESNPERVLAFWNKFIEEYEVFLSLNNVR